MSSPELNERFARQVILPGVGAEGQAKWGSASLYLAGEGALLRSAATALASSGLSRLLVPDSGGFDPASPASPNPAFQALRLPASMETLPPADLYLIATDNAELRRNLSRRLRREAKPSLFAWCAGSGYALFLALHEGGCPCLECFEVLNPKAFAQGTPEVQRLLGSLAATEALQWILNRDSPLRNRVWVTSLREGISFQHDLLPTYKCPARLAQEGTRVTP